MRSSLVPNIPSVSDPARVVRNLTLFTAPVWGIALFILLFAALGGKSDGGSVLTLIIGALLPFAFLRELWSSIVLGTVGKLTLSIIYYCASSIAMFGVGWATLQYVFGAP